jgi:hypothetical protein
MLLQARADLEQANQFELTARDFAEDPSIKELFGDSHCKVREEAGKADGSSSSNWDSRAVRDFDEDASVADDCRIARIADPLLGLEAADKDFSSSSPGSQGLEPVATISDAKIEVFRWAIPDQKRRSVHKNEPLTSDSFAVPSIKENFHFRIVYFPRGIAGAEKRNASIGLWLDASKADLKVKVAYYHYGEERPLGVEGPPLKREAGEIFCLCKNFGSAPSGELTMTVTHSWEHHTAHGRVGCLSITQCPETV